MKHIILLLSFAFFVASCGNQSEQKQADGQKVTLTIKGSDTVLPLAQKAAEKYMQENSSAAVTVIGGGSGVGIAALQDATTDIAMSSRPLKISEKLILEDAGKAFTEKIIAYDALAVVINPGNKVDQLTREQLEGIFTGKIVNWKEVGGDDMKIVAYSRESSSGTYEFFKDHVNDKKEFGSSVLLMPATGAIITSVSQTAGAIGYVGLAYINDEVKTVGVSYDQGKNFIEPSMDNALNQSYPIVRPLYFYYLNTAAEQVKPFIDYIFSEEGQKIVQEVGYIPVKK